MYIVSDGKEIWLSVGSIASCSYPLVRLVLFAKQYIITKLQRDFFPSENCVIICLSLFGRAQVLHLDE